MNDTIRVYYTIGDVQEFIEETEPTLIDLKDDILDPDPIRDKLYHLQRLYGYYSFQTPCKRAIDELRQIIEISNSLDHELVRTWVEDNISFFKNNLFEFGYTYTDEAGEQINDFYLSRHHLYIEQKPFVPIIQYCQLMWNLYYGKYYLVREERVLAEPNPMDYYYREPDPNAPCDIDVVKSILEIG